MKKNILLLLGLMVQATTALECDSYSLRYNNNDLEYFAYDDNANALACLMGLTSSTTAALFTISAYERMYENFYVFADICVNPPDSTQHQSVTPYLGVYASDNGGGAAPANAKVNLLSDLRALRTAIETKYPGHQNVSLAEWFLPLVQIVQNLRDAHVNFEDELLPQTLVFNKVFASLALDGNAKPFAGNAKTFFALQMVDLDKVETTVDGTWTAPTFIAATSTGSQVTHLGPVKTINGKPVIDWIADTFVTRNGFSGLAPFKSLGARMNNILNNYVSLYGVSFNLGVGGLTDPSVLKEQYELVFENGTKRTLHWKMVFQLDKPVVDACKIVNGDTWTVDWVCVGNTMLPPLSVPGNAFQAQYETFESLASILPTPLRPNPRVTSPSTPMGRLLHEEPAVQHVSRNLKECPTPSPNGRKYLFLSDQDRQKCKVFSFYEFPVDAEGKKYAVYKLPTYDLGVDQLKLVINFWNEFTAEAERLGVTRMMFDVFGNGGGLTLMAQLTIKMFFPTLSYGELCGASEYDKRAGPAFDAYKSIDTAAASAFVADTAAMDRRNNELQNNATELARVDRLFEQLAAAFDLYDATVKNKDSKAAAEKIYKVAQAYLDSNPKTPELLQAALNKLLVPEKEDAWLNPFNAGGVDPQKISQGPINVWSQPMVNRKRGGIVGKYTARYLATACNSLFTDRKDDVAEISNPFKNIVILTDGHCGSSCDTATSTAYALAKYSSAGRATGVKIDFATFGGLGGTAANAKKTLSATSFPGGSVEDGVGSDDIYPAYIHALLQTGGAVLAGQEKSSFGSQILQFLTKLGLPQFYATNTSNPRFTAEEIYEGYIGVLPLPSEYYFRPTDFYLPTFYAGVSGGDPTSWTETELARAYADASQIFSKQTPPPGPPSPDPVVSMGVMLSTVSLLLAPAMWLL